MNITDHFKSAKAPIRRKVNSGVFIAVIHTGKKKEGATTIPQKVDRDGDPLVRFIPSAILPTFEEFGWRKANIPNPPVSGVSEEPETEGKKTPGRKKAE